MSKTEEKEKYPIEELWDLIKLLQTDFIGFCGMFLFFGVIPLIGLTCAGLVLRLNNLTMVMIYVVFFSLIPIYTILYTMSIKFKEYAKL